MTDSSSSVPSMPASPESPDYTRAWQMDQIRREIAAAYDLNGARLAGFRETIGVKVEAVQIASAKFEDNLNRVPTTLDREISKVTVLFQEKFNSLNVQFAAIQMQFTERDVRSTTAGTAASTAVSAALQAQRESTIQQNASNSLAIDKANEGTTKQIDGILALLAGTSKSFDEKLGSIVSRLDRGDGGSLRGASSQTTNLAIVSIIVSMIGAGIVLFGQLSRPAPAIQITQPQATGLVGSPPR